MTTSARPRTRWGTIDDAAWILGTTASIVRRQMADGTFPGRFQLRRRGWRIDLDSLVMGWG